jgi:two-component system, sporulation sensor kinase E
MDKKIEELKSHIRVLSEKRALLNQVMDSLQEGILVLERDNEIVFHNRAFVRHLDISLGSGALTYKDLSAHPIFRNILDETRDRDFVHYSRDVELFSPWKKFLNVRAARLDVKGQGKAVVYLVQDSTSAKKTEEETLDQRKLGAVLQLGAGIAHELGNPMNSLGIHLQILKRQMAKTKLSVKDISAVRGEVRVLEGEIARMDAIIASFLKATRPERLQFKEVDIVETLRGALESLRDIAAERRIRIEFRPETERRFLFADPQKVQQVVVNIVKNALEAVGKDGEIAVGCREEDGFIVIRVTDTGPGIPQEQIPRIFEPFFTTKETGLGLGLVIAHRLVKEHAGDISVKSSPGAGTTFQVRLPLREYKLKFLESKKEPRDTAD